MRKIVSTGVIQNGDASVPIVPVGPIIVLVMTLSLPTYVSDDVLVRAASAYGIVEEINRSSFQNYAGIKTGTCHIKVTVTDGNPLPNILQVSGHGVKFDYRGVWRVYRWRSLKGHFKDQGLTTFCARFSIFGHDTVGCTMGRRHCGDSHASVDSTARRTYSPVTAGQRGASVSS